MLRIPSRQGIWFRLSRVGELLGWKWLIYNPGVFRSFHEAALKNAPLVAKVVAAEFPQARSIVDVGCGTGGFAAEFQKRKLRVLGFEFSSRGRRWASKRGVEVRPFDVSVSDAADLRGEHFDLVLSTEVAEHVPPELADAFVRFVVSCGDRIIFTAARPGGPARGNGHVNEQPQSYWITKFEAAGFRHNRDRSERISTSLRLDGASYYMYENMMVFERLTIPETAARANDSLPAS